MIDSYQIKNAREYALLQIRNHRISKNQNYYIGLDHYLWIYPPYFYIWHFTGSINFMSTVNYTDISLYLAIKYGTRYGL